ncbi:MAG TPA: hypothetical protein VGE20_19560 [Ramlibacter sp.]
MWKVETRVAEWRSLYGALATAELRLREARAARVDGRRTAELEFEVSRLQDESDRALQAIDAALAGARTAQQSV